jgi:CheY-like chemotaxis protein
MTGRSILVADDEPGLRDLCHFALEPLGYEVLTVADGLEAVEEIRRRPFDVVVLDVHMPNMGGPQAFEEIRRIRPDQRFVVVTSNSDFEGVFEKRVVGQGVCCLHKPISLDELTQALQSVLTGIAAGANP